MLDGVIKNGINGFFVDRFDHKFISNLIYQLKNDDLLNKRIGLEGFITVFN